ncbi:hypothetical protein B0H13DRAFT_1886548 [Mycena leptocephala]|nr:hypothetical protein B0H13DRAFT_1886548 [Mycena leptocephala]
MAPRKSRDTTPPPNPHHTRQQGPLQASGEATSAPPSSLATPAPGAGAPNIRKAKVVDKPAAAAGGSGSNPAAGLSKDKQKAVDKPAAAASGGGRNPAAGVIKKKTVEKRARRPTRAQKWRNPQRRAEVLLLRLW